MTKKDETIQRILNAAVNEIADKGYNRASTQTIANQAEVSEATIFKYFKTKKGLISGIVQHSRKLFSNVMVVHPIVKILRENPDKPFDDVLDEIIENRFELVKSQINLLIIIISEVQYHDEFKEFIHVDVFEPLLAEFEIFFKRQRELGYMKADLDSRKLLKFIAVNLLAPIVMCIYSNEKIQFDQIMKEYDVFKKIIKDGVRP